MNSKTRVDNSNAHIYSRNVPSHMTRQVVSCRPQQVRYRRFPPYIHCLHENIPEFNINTTFHPGNNAPFSGYVVDTESKLHNICHPYQKHCIQSQYIPSTKSDLYNPSIVCNDDFNNSFFPCCNKNKLPDNTNLIFNKNTRLSRNITSFV